MEAVIDSSALPVASLSRAALEQNLRALGVAGATIDLRHDGFGHGTDAVAAVAASLGAAGVIVDTDDDVKRLAAAGITAVTSGESPFDPADVFGIPGPAGAGAAVPVMTLQGRVMSTKPLRAGEAVSYGYTYRAEQDSTVALVTGGYAQGVLRALGNNIDVLVGERACRVVGRIAMDVCVVDLGGMSVADGTAVTYFGGTDAGRDALAAWAGITGLTALEIAVVIGCHVRREWV